MTERTIMMEQWIADQDVDIESLEAALRELASLRASIGRFTDSLQGQADSAYRAYILALRQDDCLGHEAKMRNGTFGVTHLQAHINAQGHLGRHNAFQAAANELGERILD
jgi:hypothetical protein